MERIEVKRTYLQMTHKSELIPAKHVDECVRIERILECPASFFRYLYREVGRQYHWIDRLDWTDEQICQYLSQPGVFLWLLSYAGTPAGYFELRQHEDTSVEIAYFGLLKEFQGRSLGKYLLTIAVEQGWQLGTNRLWVHTCTLDHPAALPNYCQRGFKPFRQETYFVTLEESLANYSLPQQAQT